MVVVLFAKTGLLVVFVNGTCILDSLLGVVFFVTPGKGGKVPNGRGAVTVETLTVVLRSVVIFEKLAGGR